MPPSVTHGVQGIVDETLANGGGSWYPDLTPFVGLSGYVCSIKGYDEKIDADQFTPEVVRNYLMDNGLAISKPGRLLGTWISKGMVYLDVSVNLIMPLDEALDFAREQGQEAIWDVAAQSEVTVPPESPSVRPQEAPGDVATPNLDTDPKIKDSKLRRAYSASDEDWRVIGPNHELYGHGIG